MEIVITPAQGEELKKLTKRMKATSKRWGKELERIVPQAHGQTGWITFRWIGTTETVDIKRMG